MTAITSLGGIPAHPLFAHVPVVLIPLGAAGAVVMCWPKVRAAIGWWVVGLVAVAGVFCQLTISAGQSLEEYVRESRLLEDHTEIGESIRPWVLLMFLALLGVMIVDRLVARRPESAATWRKVGLGLTVASLLLSAMASFTIYRIGHSGAKATWDETTRQIEGGRRIGEGGEDGEHGEGREGIRPLAPPPAPSSAG